MLAEAPPLPLADKTLGMLATSARQLGSLSCPLLSAQGLSFADSDIIMSLPRLGKKKLSCIQTYFLLISLEPCSHG